MRLALRVQALLLALLLPCAAMAADNWTVLDFQGKPVQLRSKDTGSGQVQMQVPADATGAPYAVGNPLAVGGNALAAIQANTGLIAGVSATGTLSVANDSVSLGVDGRSTAVIQLTLGSATGTAVFEGSVDGGTTYPIALSMIPYAGGASAAPLSSVTTSGVWEAAVGGLTHIRVRASGPFTGGTVAAVVRATSGVKSIRVGAPSGSPIPTVSANPSAIVAGRQTCSTTATALPSVALTNGPVIQALSTNTGKVYIGPLGVTTTTGYPLVAGQPISYGVQQLSAVFIVCDNATDIVAFTGN